MAGLRIPSMALRDLSQLMNSGEWQNGGDCLNRELVASHVSAENRPIDKRVVEPRDTNRNHYSR